MEEREKREKEERDRLARERKEREEREERERKQKEQEALALEAQAGAANHIVSAPKDSTDLPPGFMEANKSPKDIDVDKFKSEYEKAQKAGGLPQNEPEKDDIFGGANKKSAFQTPAVAEEPPSPKTDWKIISNTELNKPSTQVETLLMEHDSRNPAHYKDAKEYANKKVEFLAHKSTNETYQGGVKDKKPHGWGKLTTKKGEIVEGLFLDGKPASNLRKFENEGTILDGHLVNDKLEGKGVMTRANGNVVSCDTWKDGKPSGFYTEIDKRGKTIFKGAKTEHGLEGQCTVIEKDFTVEGRFSKGDPAGPMKKVYKSGQSRYLEYIGELACDLTEEGQGEVTFNDGRKFKGPFMNGVPNGEGQFTSDRGVESKQTFKMGKKILV